MLSKVYDLLKKYGYEKEVSTTDVLSIANFFKRLDHRHDIQKENYKVGEGLKRLGFEETEFKDWMLEDIVVELETYEDDEMILLFFVIWEDTN